MTDELYFFVCNILCMSDDLKLDLSLHTVQTIVTSGRGRKIYGRLLMYMASRNLYLCTVGLYKR